MGVIEMFGTLAKIDITSSSIRTNFREKMPVDHFFLDFNSIIHVSSQATISEVNTLLKLVLATYQDRHYPSSQVKELLTQYELDLDISRKTRPMKIVKAFHDHFDPSRMDRLVMTATVNNMLRMIRAYCQDNVIQTIMIAIDGVPSKGKLIEQRQRRYMSAVIEAYKRKLNAKYEEYLEDQPKNIYYATTYPIIWNRTKISPGTRFMYRLGRHLQGKTVTAALHKDRPRVQIIFSGMDEIGEAEKKIVNYITHKMPGTPDRIVIYSPDADMILLCLLLPVENVQMLRHNQQTSTHTRAVYDLIDTPVLKNNIAYYVNQISDSKTSFDSERISRDLVCLSTIFGNDFVPKIESISVKKGFQNLLDAYQVVLENQGDYLVRMKGTKSVLSLSFLKKIVRELLPVEEDFVKNNSLYQKYVTIGQIKNVFSNYDVTESTIKTIYLDFTRRYGDLKVAVRNDRDLEHFTSDHEFMASLKKALMIRDEGGQAVNTSYLSDSGVLEILRDHLDRTGDFPRLNINLNTFGHSIRDRRHQQDTREMNDCEKEKYQFEKMLDEYYVKLNAQPLDLSAPKIPDYYRDYFGIDSIVSKGALTEEGSEICREYLEGILWVFNYYFNDTTYISTWYYPHEKTPLLRHLSLFLDSLSRDEFKKLETGLESYQVKKLSRYFNPVEQFLYVCPMTEDNLVSVPEEIREVYESDEMPTFLQSFYIDVDEIVDQLWKEKVSKTIDCRSIPYFNKCLIKGITRPTAEDDRKFLKGVRSLPQGKNYRIRAATGIPPY